MSTAGNMPVAADDMWVTSGLYQSNSFFFQAEDGIRVADVTGVQTCALPISGSWRDSRVGYAGGRFAFDVNAVWVPAALRAVGAIDSTLRALGLPGVPQSGEGDVARAAETWRGTARHFEVVLAPAEVEARVRAKLASLPAAERLYWEQKLIGAGLPTDTLRFYAVSLDSVGVPIPVMSTDPAMWLLLENLDSARQAEVLRDRKS